MHDDARKMYISVMKMDDNKGEEYEEEMRNAIQEVKEEQEQRKGNKYQTGQPKWN